MEAIAVILMLDAIALAGLVYYLIENHKARKAKQQLKA